MECLYTRIAEVENSTRKAALCIIVDTRGSAPRKQGAKMLVLDDGSISGSIGGGALEMQVIRDALNVIETQKPALFSHALVHDHGMCCGGTVQIFIEPVMNRKKLYIFGAGHIGKMLAWFANALDFKVTLIDERYDAFQGWNVSGCSVINKKHNAAFKELTFDDHTFLCVVTHSHSYDREIVAYCAKKAHAYLGMIGSRRKVEIARKTFRAGKILTEKEMEEIDMPMGIPIKAQTPGEIAIAILAGIINVRAKINSGK